jgi:hypothetical protein
LTRSRLALCAVRSGSRHPNSFVRVLTCTLVGLIHVALVGENADLILKPVRELGGDEVILIGGGPDKAMADRIAGSLKPLGVRTSWRPVQGDMLLGFIRLMQEIAREHSLRRDEVVVNLAAGSRGATCAALSACFVAGLKAIDNDGGNIVVLPVLRFSYDEVVSDAKLAMLRALDTMGGVTGSLKDLAKGAEMQDSLASYHIRGGRDGRGLSELGLVEVDRGERGALIIRITPMGRLMARGLSP